jgi:hypothetical protein
MKYSTASVTMHTLNIYESRINKSKINNSVEFSKKKCNGYRPHTRIGRVKLLCEIILEQETIRGDFFLEPKIFIFRVDIDNKTP